MDIAGPGGTRIRRSTGTSDRKEAKAYEAKLAREVWQARKLGAKPRALFATAATRWLKERAGKASIRDDARHILFWREHITYLDEIDRQMLTDKLDQFSPATANRYLATLRAIIRAAWDEWDMLDAIPRLPKPRKEPEGRVRFLRPDEADRLRDALPESHRPLYSFLLTTGVRLGAALKLRWQDVDLERKQAWIVPAHSKNRRAIPVPLHDAAHAALVSCQGRHPVLVFAQNRPTTATWKRALKRAGIEDFRIHDLRHTWASWHAQNGTPLYDLQVLGGWARPDMVRRYAHLSQDRLMEVAGNWTKH